MALIIRPWANASDLTNVWNLFSSQDSDAHIAQRKACDIVQIWQTRGKLPHHILSTAALIDAQLHDRIYTQTLANLHHNHPHHNHHNSNNDNNNYSKHNTSIRSLTAIHAMALLSFITGAADIEQTKDHKVSMFEVARGIGLPARLVEIRHSIVHECVPPLAVLRQATREALEWLQREYWVHVVVD